MLYRIDLMAAKGEDDFQAACDMEEWLSKHGVLVPVEPDYEGLADSLHHMLCQYNHIDGCAYHYIKWSDEDRWGAKKEWMDKGKALLDAALKEGT